MKKITISGQEFEYKVCVDVNELGDFYETAFYQGTETKQRKKYIFFGETITETVPKEIFAVAFNIENILLLKEEVKKRLESALYTTLALQNRPREIAKGEII